MAKSASDKGKDNRFAAIGTDPRFQLPKKKSIRGEVDSRFKDALANDERFSKKATIDKYGRRAKKRDPKKELSRYYNFEDDHEDEEPAKASSSSDVSENSDFSDPADSDSSVSEPDAAKKRKPTMRELMRGEGLEDVESDESEPDSDSDSDSDASASDLEQEVEDEYESIRSAASAVPQGDESRRLAVVNLDWDNVSSTDLMATFSSFVPANSRINSVKIYLSEFGKKQMAQEELHGPPQHLFDSDKKSKDMTKKEENKPVLDDDKDYSSSKLRKYQLQRLQYFYAVVDCDSVATATAIYTSCDGTEYESTANFFDLRFIPDDVAFNDKPRDECYKVPSTYQPTNFTTDALQHSKVKLTWDESPKERARLAQKAFTDKNAEDEDLKAYLASGSDSDEDEETIANRYRSLLGDTNGASNAADAGSESDSDAVEITFNPVLEGKEAKLEILDDERRDKNAPQDGALPEDNLSTIERYRLKEKQRRLRRMENYKSRKAAEAEQEKNQTGTNQAELELLAMDDDLLDKATATATAQEQPSAKKPGKKITKRAAKKKALEEAEQDFDTSDPRFQALFEDPDFAIDSTLPQYKQTKGMERIIGERRKRQAGKAQSNTMKAPKRRPDNTDDTQQLISKLRRKTQEKPSS